MFFEYNRNSKMGKDIFHREQKHVCGKNIESAGYMEIDLYPVTRAQHRSGTRAKKKEASTLAQQTYNEKRAKRYHVQLVNTNFGANDYSWTGTYNDEHLPDPDDREKADRDWSNYMKRVYRWCDRSGVDRPKWIMATEYSTRQEDGKVLGRTHHHAIIQHTDGLSRDVLEDLWRDKNGISIGLCRCDHLEVDHGSVESLVSYISKNKRCDRSWRQSKGLQKPITPKPNDSKWSRKKFDDAGTMLIDDRDFWEKQYPGFIFDRAELTVSNTGMKHLLVIMYRENGYHAKRGTAGRMYGEFYGAKGFTAENAAAGIKNNSGGRCQKSGSNKKRRKNPPGEDQG